MEMLRRTIRTAFRSFRMLRRRPEENEGSRRVHLQLNMMFYWEFTSEDMREFSYIGEETSSFYVNLSSLGTVEETAIQILQHLSNSEFEPLLLLIDDITLALSEMIHRVLAGRPSDLQAGVPPVISLSMRVTYHVEGWQDLAMNVEDQSTLRPASKASIDALERRKVEQEEESGENMCVVCQDEVGRSGDCIAMLSCSHEFHEDCILAWLERAYSCPVCRFELPTD